MFVGFSYLAIGLTVNFHFVTILQQLPLTRTLKEFFPWLKPVFW